MAKKNGTNTTIFTGKIAAFLSSQTAQNNDIKKIYTTRKNNTSFKSSRRIKKKLNQMAQNFGTKMENITKLMVPPLYVPMAPNLGIKTENVTEKMDPLFFFPMALKPGIKMDIFTEKMDPLSFIPVEDKFGIKMENFIEKMDPLLPRPDGTKANFKTANL